MEKINRIYFPHLWTVRLRQLKHIKAQRMAKTFWNHFQRDL